MFTSALLGRGVPEHRLALVELGDDFADALQRRFPLATVVRHDASRLGSLQFFDGELAGAVVSGLPLLAMDRHVHYDILSESFRMLQPGGSFVQFTYSMRPPVSRDVIDALDLDVERAGQTVRNFPPATVFRFTRRDA